MTATTLGALRVALSMDSAAFSSGVSKARGALRDLARGAAVAQTAVAAAGAGLAAYAATSAEAATAMKGLATVANAGLGEFQRWGLAAKTVGIEHDKLADILKDVEDKLGDFLAGEGGEMKDFFDLVAPKVGVTAEMFRNLSGPQALQLYVSSLEKANLSQAEMTFYMEAIANDATLLLPLLKNNGAELERIAGAASRYGLMSEEAAAAGKAMREAQVQLAAAWTALGDALAGSGIVEAMAALTRAGAEFIGLKLVPAIRGIGAAAKGLAEALGLSALTIADLSAAMERIGTYAATAAALLAGRFAVALGVATVATLRLRTALVRSGWGLLIVALGEAVYQIGNVTGRLGGLGEALRLLGDLAAATFHGIGEEVLAVAMRFDAMGKEITAIWARLLGWMAQKWSEFVARIAPAFNAISERIGAGIEIDALGVAAWASSFDAAVLRAEQAAGRLRAGALEKLRSAWDQQTAAVEALKRAWAEGGKQAETGAEDAARAWEEALKRMQEAMAGLGGGAGGDGSGKEAKDAAPKTSPLPIPRGGIDEGLKSFREDLARVGAEGARDLWGALIRGGDGFGDVLKRVAGRLADTFGDRAFAQLGELLFGSGEKTDGKSNKTGGAQASGLEGIMGKLVDGIGGKLDGIFGGFGDRLATSTDATFGKLGEQMTGGLGDILGGLGDSLGDLLGGLGDALGGIFGGSGGGGIGSLFGGGSGGGFGSIFGSLFGGGGSAAGAAASGGGSAFSSILGSIPFFAEGTSFAPRGMALVGEKGPELVKFRGGEQVVPNRDLGAALAPQAAPAPVVNFEAVNVLDPSLIGDWVSRPGNARRMINHLRAEGADL